MKDKSKGISSLKAYNKEVISWDIFKDLQDRRNESAMFWESNSSLIVNLRVIHFYDNWYMSV